MIKSKIDREAVLTALLCLASAGLIGLVVHTIMWRSSAQTWLQPAPEEPGIEVPKERVEPGVPVESGKPIPGRRKKRPSRTFEA